MIVHSAPPTAPIPSHLPLGPEGRGFMLAYLRANLSAEIPLTVESWREIYGKACDYQTVCNLRADLASEVAA